MRHTILDIVSSSPEIRQSRRPYRSGRDAWIVHQTNYGSTGTTVTSSSASFPAGDGFWGAALLRDGRVFCGCWGANRTSVVYDPITDTITNCINGDPTDNSYSKDAWLLPDGRVFLPPHLATDNGVCRARIYDPATNKVFPLPATYPSNRYDGGLVLFDGRVYCTPGGFDRIPIIIDPRDGSSTVPPIDYQLAGYNTAGSRNAIQLFDGRVWTSPFISNYFFLWEPNSNSLETVYTGGNNDGAWNSSGVLQDGRIAYMAVPPNQSRQYKIFDPYTKTIATSPVTVISDPKGLRLFPDGRVLSYHQSFTLQWQIFAPDMLSVANISRPPDIRYSTSLLLPDGRMLMVPQQSRNNTINRFAFIGDRLSMRLPDARTMSTYYK